MVKQFHQHSSSLQITIFIGGIYRQVWLRVPIPPWVTAPGAEKGTSRLSSGGAAEVHVEEPPELLDSEEMEGEHREGAADGEDSWFYYMNCGTGGLEHEWIMTFHIYIVYIYIYIYIIYIYMYIGNFIIPSDELIFFRGVETTNQL